MSKLDVIVLKYGNAVLDLPKTNDPIGKPLDEAIQQIKDLMLELTNDEYEAAYNRNDSDPVYEALVRIRQKVHEL